MIDFSLETWALMAAVAATGTLAMLHTLAHAYQQERRVHDLKLRVIDLRKSYTKRLAELQGRGEVVEVGEDGDR